MDQFSHPVNAYRIYLTERMSPVRVGLRRAGELAQICRRCGHLVERESVSCGPWRHVGGPGGRVATLIDA